MLACPRCGEENTDTARFCSHCGTRLGVAFGEARAVRKAVTVVFTDVTGFTNLAERLDPERLSGVMSRYFDEMRSVVERHGGKVEKFIGDAVAAVFGVPRLHEDDAVRAVRAAAEMRDAVESLNKELEVEWGLSIQIRTGVNTGEVIAGDGDRDDALVLGDTVNVAARLQQAARPQEVLLGDDTYRLVRTAVEAELLEPLALKGKALPVTAYRLMHVRPGPVPRRLDSPLVGRGGELALVRQAFDQAVAQRRCSLLTLVGPAGIGKSRLAAEFLASLDGAAILQGHCLAYGDGITFWPVTEVVRQATDVSDDDSPDQARSKIASAVQDDQGGLILEKVGHAIGLSEEGPAAPDEIAWAVRKLLEGLGRRQPLVVVFEDCHWAEPAFLDLVEHIADWSRDTSILLLCLARPELLGERPGWDQARTNRSVVKLEPLPDEDGELVIANLLGGQTLDESVMEQIRSAAEGNPLFLEEVLAMLIDGGFLQRGDGKWIPRVEQSSITVPLSLQALLAARLDRLAADDRLVMEVASVIGAEFYRDAVSELLPEPVRSHLDESLASLLAKEFIRPASSVFGENAFRFHHGLFRDTAYNEMPKASRAQLHERFAAWLEKTTSDRLADHDEIIGYHLEQAFRYQEELRPVDDHGRLLARQAAGRLGGAGRRALARSDVLAAAKVLSRAVSLLPSADELRVGLLPELSEALMSTGAFEQADAFLNEALDAAAAAGDVSLQTHLLLSRLTQRLFTDQLEGPDEARREAEKAIQTFDELDDEVGLARSWRLLSLVHLTSAHFSAAEEAMDRAAHHAHNAADRREELDSLFWLPLPLWAGPATPEEGIRRCEEVLQRSNGDPKVEATVLFIRGGFAAMLGQFAEARRLLSAARAVLEDLGMRVWIAGPFAQVSGWVELLAGQPEAAERELRSGYEALVGMGETGLSSTVSALLAVALLGQERHDEAAHFTRISEETAGGGDVYSQVVLRAARAKALVGQGRLEEGEQLAREAVRLAEETDSLQIRGDALANLAEVLQVVGAGDESRAAMRNALHVYERKGNVVSAEGLRKQLESLPR